MAVRVTQVPVEGLRAGTPTVRVTQVGAEVVRSGTPTVRVTQVAVEVLRATEIVTGTVVMVIE